MNMLVLLSLKKGFQKKKYEKKASTDFFFPISASAVAYKNFK